MKQTTSPHNGVRASEQASSTTHALRVWREALLTYSRASLDLVAAEAKLAIRALAAIQVLIILASGLALSAWLAACTALGYWLVSAMGLPVVAGLLIISALNLLLFAVCIATGRWLLKDVDFPLSRRHFFENRSSP